MKSNILVLNFFFSTWNKWNLEYLVWKFISSEKRMAIWVHGFSEIMCSVYWKSKSDQIKNSFQKILITSVYSFLGMSVSNTFPIKSESLKLLNLD